MVTTRLSPNDPGGQEASRDDLLALGALIGIKHMPLPFSAPTETVGQCVVIDCSIVPDDDDDASEDDYLPAEKHGCDSDGDAENRTRKLIELADPDDDRSDDRGDAADDIDPDCDTPLAPAGASAGLAICAPRGPLPVVPGFTVAAVEIDVDECGDEQIVEAVFLAAKLRTSTCALALACYKAKRPGLLPIKRATHIVVNDHTGREVLRRELVRAAG